MKKNNKTKNNKLALKSLLFALGLAVSTSTMGCSNLNNEHRIENSDCNHDHDLDFDSEVVANGTANYGSGNEIEYKILNIKEVNNNFITDYKGYSIVDALKLCGIDSSFSNRSIIASHLGIDNYRGTAYQNITMLNTLRGHQVSSYAKVSDIKDICKNLFGKDAKKVIKDLNLPKTTNITKIEFARIIRKIANHMNIDTSVYNDKLNLVIDSINDVEYLTNNSTDIAWSYFMGYTDLDEFSNYNLDRLVSVNELNWWINSFVFDYNYAVQNNISNDNGLIIAPGADKYDRDMYDKSGINDIRGNAPNKNNNNNNNNGTSQVNPHVHKYEIWSYHDADREVSTCQDCGQVSYRPHGLIEKNISFESNQDATHKVIETMSCGGCGFGFINEYNVKCDLSLWGYNKEIKLDERGCLSCGYTETREHEHEKAPLKLVYKLDKTNGNGTHQLIAEYDCKLCDDKVTLYKEEICDLSLWDYNNQTGLEERECSVCDYTETREHEHDKVPSNLIYKLYKTNFNGTHKLKAEYECKVCEDKISLYKDVKCNLSAWGYNKETSLEERKCGVCDYTETREHEHDKAPSKLDYVLDETNGDGTHKLVASYDCKVCGEEIKSYKNENCNLSAWGYNKETSLEERKCGVCDYTETREHEHDKAPSKLDYVLDETNGDGTHKLVASYDCKVCNQKITLYKNENCSYGPWEKNDVFTCKEVCEVCNHRNTKNHDFEVVPNSVTSNATIGKHNQMERCNDCDFEKQVEVSCVGDGNSYYHKDGDIVTERENCSSCGDVCKDIPHNHTYGGYEVVDDESHKRTCDCGNISTEAHSYGEWNVTSDGKNTRECSSCGHVQSVSHTCNITSSDVFPSSYTKDYCYEIVNKCIIEGCNQESRVKVDHNYKVDSSFFGAVYTCYNCGYSYSEKFFTTMSLETDDIVLYKDDEKEEENACCKKLVLR